MLSAPGGVRYRSPGGMGDARHAVRGTGHEKSKSGHKPRPSNRLASVIRTPSLRSLDLFVTLMAARSLSDAARRIGITQPAASLALKELEAQIGVPLFVRSRQGLVPTPQAERLLPHAERLISQAQMVHRQIVGLRDGAASSLRLACIPSFGSTLLPATLERFRAERPDVEVKIEVEPLARILDLLRQEVVDVAFAYLPERTEDAPSGGALQCILDTPLACLMRRDDPLGARDHLLIDDLAERTIILPSQAYLPIPAALLGLLGDSRLIVVNNVYAAMSLARAGGGIALANPLLLLSAVDTGLIARPLRPSARLILGVLRALPHAQTPEVESLVNHAHAIARDHVAQLHQLGIDASAP